MSDIAPRLGTRPSLTATAALDLATTRTLTKALALLGLRWDPAAFGEATTSERGLYTWAIGRGHDDTGLLDRPVLYVGVGCGADGLRRRLTNETSWVTEDAAHVHGRAAFRLAATPVGGPVHRDPDPDLSWLDEISVLQTGAEQLRSWLAAPGLAVDVMAERLCIRAAAHIGDTPPPVNSQFATAWNSNEAWDWGGWAAAQQLARTLG